MPLGWAEPERGAHGLEVVDRRRCVIAPHLSHDGIDSKEDPAAGGGRKLVTGRHTLRIALALAGALAVLLSVVKGPGVAVLVLAAAGLIPVVGYTRDATSNLVLRTGPGRAVLLNVTFDNIPLFLFLALSVSAGLHEAAKASLVGVVLANVLLGLGAAMFVGGARRERQYFDATAASSRSGMVMLGSLVFLLPGLFQLINGDGLPAAGTPRMDFGSPVEQLSIAIALVLMFCYCAGILFALRTHADLFNPPYYDEFDESSRGLQARWSTRRALGVLALATGVGAVLAEIVVDSIASTAQSLGVSTFFVGVVVGSIVGVVISNMIEEADRDKMEIVVNAALERSAQVALVVGPAVVLLSLVAGPAPMPLVFNGYELAAMIIAILVARFATISGECDWFTGVQLVTLYCALALTFYFA